MRYPESSPILSEAFNSPHSLVYDLMYAINLFSYVFLCFNPSPSPEIRLYPRHCFLWILGQYADTLMNYIQVYTILMCIVCVTVHLDKSNSEEPGRIFLRRL